eukprot:SAG22_NODE_101_length_20519_cov_15.588002_7_plen_141_part_00
MDMDSDTSHPFLLLSPESYVLVCNLAQTELRESECTEPTAEVPIDIITRDTKWSKQETRMHSPDSDLTPIEQHLFVAREAPEPNITVDIKIKPSMYTKDEVLQELYEFVQADHSVEEIAKFRKNALRATQKQGSKQATVI